MPRIRCVAKSRCHPLSRASSPGLFSPFCPLSFVGLFFLLPLLSFFSSSHTHLPMAGVELLFGPMLIGVVLNMMLYGVVCIQIYAYFQRYPNDSAWIRYFMLYLLIVETANVVVEVGIIYQPLIIEYGQQARLSPKLLPGDAILISIVSAPIQLFTAWRMSVITESLILPVFISLLSLGSFASGITVSVMVVLNPAFGSFERFETEIAVWLGLSAACDIVIAAGMSYALYTRRTGFGAIDGQINRIIRLTVETGALTAITALVDVTLFLAFPRTTLNFIVDFPLSALYTCSILAMLNSRDRRKTTDAERATHMLTTDQTAVKRPMSFHPSRKSQLPVDVYTHTATFTEKGKVHNVTASQDTLVSDPPRPDFSASISNGSRTMTPDIPRTRSDSNADSDPLVLNPPQPDFYNYNRSGSPTTRSRKLSESSSATLNSLPPNARSLPSNPRPRRPMVPEPQLALRPKTIIGPERPLPERF
ncbi:hypothetical protein C8R45DRAFT_999737 [Mycena sanguinolenta]|nr:hypothetical protein C8R45DRAFT_999737 [Mycena sanguinolenta]